MKFILNEEMKSSIKVWSFIFCMETLDSDKLLT